MVLFIWKDMQPPLSFITRTIQFRRSARGVGYINLDPFFPSIKTLLSLLKQCVNKYQSILESEQKLIVTTLLWNNRIFYFFLYMYCWSKFRAVVMKLMLNSQADLTRNTHKVAFLIHPLQTDLQFTTLFPVFPWKVNWIMIVIILLGAFS